MSKLSDDPYKYKHVRKSLDGCAFNMYGHWVKHGEQQNREALFEAMPRCHINANHLLMLSKHGPTQQKIQKMHKALKNTVSIVD